MIYKLEIESDPKNLVSFHTTLDSAENLAKHLGYGKTTQSLKVNLQNAKKFSLVTNTNKYGGYYYVQFKI